MSGALTDIGRDQERSKKYGKFLEALIAYLREQTWEGFAALALAEAAEDTDEIKGGYSSEETRLSDSFEMLLGNLLDGDEETWVKLLSSASNYDPAFSELKALSPFARHLLLDGSSLLGFRVLGSNPSIQNALNEARAAFNERCVIALPLSDSLRIEVIKVRKR